MSQDPSKRAAAARAVQYVKPRSRVGLGTGSTSLIFLELLAQRNREEKLGLSGVATSESIARQAAEWGIPVAGRDEPFDELDIAVDGADEVDPQGQLVKGGGGALLREKLVALSAKAFLVIVDEAKHVPRLGHQFLLPIEIVPFGWSHTVKRLEACGLGPKLREKEGKRYVTDNGNLIADCTLGPVDDVRELARRVKLLPGVVETGFFVDMTDIVITGSADGNTREAAFGARRLPLLGR